MFMSKSQYKELLEFLVTQFGKIDQRFDRLENRVTNLENNQDSFFKELLEFRQEFTVSSFRISRIEEWVTKAAPKLDLPYNP